jgi:hypothetical protein
VIPDQCSTHTRLLVCSWLAFASRDLVAALDLLQGKVIADCYKLPRHQEFLKFLRRIDREFAGDTDSPSHNTPQ